MNKLQRKEIRAIVAKIEAMLILESLEDSIVDEIMEVYQRVEAIKDCEEDKTFNMPDGLAMGARGQAGGQAVGQLRLARDALGRAMDDELKSDPDWSVRVAEHLEHAVKELAILI